MRESPTLIGIRGNRGPTPPASNINVKFGAEVFCASIDAAHGAPVPTTTIAPSSINRDAAQIIISIELNSLPVTQQAPVSSDSDDGGPIWTVESKAEWGKPKEYGPLNPLSPFRFPHSAFGFCHESLTTAGAAFGK